MNTMALGKILVTDDDKNICELLRLYLEKEGYSVILAHDGEEALLKFETLHPDLMLLDIMLPGLDGWQVCREVRKKSQVPIIMLTAKGETFDKVLGLELGADDYVAKPFGILELLSRIRAVARRTVESDRQAADEGSGVFEYQNIYVDEASHIVTVDGNEVMLTRKEFKLLCDLMRNQGRVLTRDQIMEQVWGFDYGGATRTVDIHINTLRKKLGDDGTMIQTVRGVGYKIGK